MWSPTGTLLSTPAIRHHRRRENGRLWVPVELNFSSREENKDFLFDPNRLVKVVEQREDGADAACLKARMTLFSVC